MDIKYYEIFIIEVATLFISPQTVVLHSVSAITKALTYDEEYVRVNDLFYEAYSPYTSAAVGNRAPWIRYSVSSYIYWNIKPHISSA